MSRFAQSRFGWKEIGACVVATLLLLLAWTALSPTRNINVATQYRETTFVRAFATRDISSDSANHTEASALPEGDATDNSETEKDLPLETPHEESYAAAHGDGTALEEPSAPTAESAEDAARVEHQTAIGESARATEEGAAVQGDAKGTQPIELKNHYQFDPEENYFVGDENVAATSFRMVSVSLVELAYAEMCTQCAESSCERRCQIHQALLNRLNESAVDSRNARLHVIPVDPLSWYRRRQGDSQEYRAGLLEFVSLVKSAYPYRTFKGSDHVFVCLSDDECSEFGEDLSKQLAGDLGSRAIFASMGLNNTSFSWPCPLRIINLDTLDINNMPAAVDRIIQRATFMIQKRNRWICSDRNHPDRQWLSAKSTSTSGVVMKKYGFMICAIPKSGSTMTKVLLRRISGFKNWNQTGTGINQSPKRSGLEFFGSIGRKRQEAITHDLKFVKGVIVRHPISRLLSGYLDKIYQKHQFSRVPGLKKCLTRQRSSEPDFHKFVHCLVHHHPNPDHLDHHFKIQSSFCNLRRTELDFVGKQSNLLEEMREFGESLSFWEEYGASGWGNGSHAFGEKSYQTRTHNSGNLIWDYYTEDLMKEVYKYYKEDFDRFGFTLEEMLATKPNRTYPSTHSLVS